MQLVTMKCPACAAMVNFDNDQPTFKCEYCKNQISIIKPVTVSEIVAGLSGVRRVRRLGHGL
jgi:primosomal protein N'